MARADWGIGIIGLGGIAEFHLEGYRKAGLAVVGGAEVNRERHAVTVEKWKLPFITQDFRELIDRSDVRIVDITVPHDFDIRRPIVEYAASQGKAILIQKPLMPYFDQAKHLVEFAESHRVPLMVNQNSIFVPAFMAIEPFLRDGAIGVPYYLQIENRSWWDPGSHPWFGKDERWITSDMAVHHFALAIHWFGEWESVYSIMARDCSQTNVYGDTLSVVNVEFAAGMKGCIMNNWCYRGHIRRPHSVEEIIVQGDGGCISGHSEDIRIITTEEPVEIHPAFEGKWFPEAFANTMSHFVDSLDHGTPHLCDGRSNLSVVALVEAAYRSSSEHRVVRRSEFPD